VASRRRTSEEAAFLRGDVGVDGAATEEAKDKAEVEQGKAREAFLRGKAWLGRELLTWLLFRSEKAEPLIARSELAGQPVSILLADRLVLRGISGEVVESIFRGSLAPYSPLVRRALDRGLLVHQARLQIAHGELQFEVTLDAEQFCLRGAKLPELTSEDEDDRLRERLQLSEQLSGLVRELLHAFLRLRSSPRWAKEEVPALKAWMAEAAEDQGDHTRRKRRAG
jgi:hypothetical protein